MKRWGAAIAGSVVVIGWFVFGPSQFGGPVSYIAIHGNSMEPSLRAGDLVLTREADRYEPDDVVAFHSDDLGRTVLHRVVDASGEQLVTKGDNNPRVDGFQPVAADVMGAQWVRIPRGGTALNAVRDSRTVAAVVALGILVSLGRNVAAKERRRRREEDDTGQAVPVRRPARFQVASDRRNLVVAATLTAVLLAGFGALTRQPASEQATVPAEYRQEGRFGWHATVPPGAVYPDGTVDAGEPVFLTVVDGLDISFEYTLTGDRVDAVHGTASVTAYVEDEHGWRHRVDLATDVAFDGPVARFGGRLDLAAVRALLDAVETDTDLQRSKYTIRVEPEVTVAGTVAGVGFDDEFSPRLVFDMDERVLRTAQPDDPADRSLLEPTREGRVSVPAVVPSEVGFGPVGVPVDTLRTLTMLGVVIGVGATVALALRARRRHGDEARTIRSLHGRWLVPVADATSGTNVVEVASFEGLVRLAEQHERLVLDQTDADAFVVRIGDTAYRYQPGAQQAAEGPTGARLEEPARSSTEEPAAEPVEEPAAELAEESAEEPAEEPAEQPVEELGTEPLAEPAGEPAGESAGAGKPLRWGRPRLTAVDGGQAPRGSNGGAATDGWTSERIERLLEEARSALGS